MRFLRYFKGCRKIYYLTNKDTWNELGIVFINRNIEESRRNWLEYLGRMSEWRTLKQILTCSPKEKRDVGRPRKRCREIWVRNRKEAYAMKRMRRKRTTTGRLFHPWIWRCPESRWHNKIMGACPESMLFDVYERVVPNACISRFC
jgi:hypothetical protein